MQENNNAVGLKGKTLSLPMRKGGQKALSKMSSNMTTDSLASSNKYAEPAERLDWSVQYLTDLVIPIVAVVIIWHELIETTVCV